jgi:hypothetical protein
MCELPEQVRSIHGEMQTPAAGKDNPASRNEIIRAIVKPAPAESPATTIFEASIPESSNQRYAEIVSSTAAGNGFSGAKL